MRPDVTPALRARLAAVAGTALGLLLIPAVSRAAPPGDAVTAAKPPRIDGGYVGGSARGATSFARVDDLEVPAPLFGPGGSINVGDAVFHWLTIGIELAGGGGFASGQQVGFGGIMVELGFLPIRDVPFSIRTGAGFGAGAVLDAGQPGRFGFGGAMFKGALRYEFFPVAARKRPRRGGGWSIGPELGWLGHTPAGPGRPMANTAYLGLWTGFYFGS